MGSALRVLALVVAASLGGAEQSAQELTLALQRHYDAVRDFSADFAHTYQGGV